MAETTIAFTKIGWMTLINQGLVETLKYYSFNDSNNLYNITATNSILPKVTGSHFQITNAFCGKAQYNGMYPTKPVTAEINNAISRLVYNFNKTDCSYEFSQPNLVLKVNINDWLNELESLNYSSYSYNMSETLTQTLWDFVSVTTQKLDLTTNNYENVNSLTNLNLSYTPITNIDLTNYNILSPKNVRVNNNSKELMYSPTKFASPFLFTLSTENINGSYIYGTSGKISLVHDGFGYLIGPTSNGNFQSIATVENSDYNTLESITPAVKIGSDYYHVTSNTSWNTKNGLIGWMLNMVNYKDPSKTALQALIERTILFFKSEGELINGSYVIPVSFNVTATEPTINNITNIVGNMVTIQFSYTPNVITGQIIQNITN